MAVYHFTFHAFGTWSANHPRGYTLREEGYRGPNDDEQIRRLKKMTQPIITFDRTMQELLIAGTHDICQRRGWTFHGAGSDPTHFHSLVSWKEFLDWRDARDQLKNVLSLFLGRATGIINRTWFVDGGSRKRVTNRKHFDYLLDEYFPDHRGVFWREGMPLPGIPKWILTGKPKPGASATGYEEEKRPRDDGNSP